MNDPFGNVDQKTILKFVSENPLAWVVPNARPDAALLMPVIFAPGSTTMLLGHLPRRAAASAVLKREPDATFLFLGPNSYIPTHWIRKSGWGPTWNFTSVSMSAEIELETSLTRPAIEALVGQLEGQSGSDWSTAELGERYEEMLSQIIGFSARPHRITPRFKLGQDESPETQEDLRKNLAGHPLLDWINTPID